MTCCDKHHAEARKTPVRLIHHKWFFQNQVYDEKPNEKRAAATWHASEPPKKKVRFPPRTKWSNETQANAVSYELEYGESEFDQLWDSIKVESDDDWGSILNPPNDPAAVDVHAAAANTTIPPPPGIDDLDTDALIDALEEAKLVGDTEMEDLEDPE